MSPSRLPGTVATIAASSAARVVSSSRRDSSSTAPTGIVIAASACQPSTMAPQSIDTMSPSSITRSPGMPCTITSFGRDAGDGREAVVAEEVRPGAAPVEHLARRGVEIGGRRARLGREGARLVHLGDDAAGPAHDRDLLGRLAQHHRSAPVYGQRRASTTLTRRLNTSSPSPTPLDLHEHAALAVVLDDRHGLLFVELEPAVDRLFGVVVALHDPAAARVAGPVDLGRQVHVVHALAALAHAPAGEPVEHDVAGHVEVDREVERCGRRARGRAPWPGAASAGTRRARSRRRADRPARGTPRSRRRRSRRGRARRCP